MKPVREMEFRPEYFMSKAKVRVVARMLKEFSTLPLKDELLEYFLKNNETLFAFTTMMKGYLEEKCEEPMNSPHLELIARTISFLLTLIGRPSLKMSNNFSKVGGTLLPIIIKVIKSRLGTIISGNQVKSKIWLRLLGELSAHSMYLPQYVPKFNSFVEFCIESSMISLPGLQKKLMLLVVAMFRNTESHKYIKNMYIKVILDGHDKYKKWQAVCGTKMSPHVFLLVALIQNGLTFYDDEKYAFERTFSFAASVVNELADKCAKNERSDTIVAFFECLIQDLLLLLFSPVWPGARLLFHIVNKTLASYFNLPRNFKLQTTFVRQLSDIVVSIKKLNVGCTELESRLKLECHNEDYQQTLRTAFANFCKENSNEEFVGDLGKIYRILESRTNECNDFQASSTSISLSQQEAAFAAHCLDYLTKTEDSYFKYILAACQNAKKEIKTTAAISLSKVLVRLPCYWLRPQVKITVLNLIPVVTIYGKESILSAITSTLTDPAAFRLCYEHLLLLLRDPCTRIRVSVIKSVTAFFTKPEGELASNYDELFMRIVKLANDDDVHQAIVEFLKVIFLKSECYLDTLIRISKYEFILKFMERMLASLQSSERAVCQSQANSALPSQNDNGCLDNLATSLVARVSNSKEVVPLLEILARINPLTLKEYLHVFVSKAREASCLSTKRSLAEIVSLLLPSCSDKEARKSIQMAHDELNSSSSLEWNVATVIAFLKIVKQTTPDELKSQYLNQSEAILSTPQITTEREKREIIRALIIVAYLNREGERKKQLLMDFLGDSTYKMTLLKVESRLRLEYISPIGLPVLEEEVKRNLTNRTDVDLTALSLYFIICTLQGYKSNKEERSMKHLGQASTEAVSHLIQKTLDLILACTLEISDFVRKGAFTVVSLIVDSGLVLMPKLLPYICAMTADPVRDIRLKAKSLLQRASREWSLSLPAVQGIVHARSLMIKSQSQHIRGFLEGKYVSTFHAAYDVIQNSVENRRKFISYLLKALVESKDLGMAVYMGDHVAYLPYKTYDEVFFTVYEINKLISLMTEDRRDILALLKRIKSFFLGRLIKTQKKVLSYLPNAKPRSDPLPTSNLLDYLPEKFCNKPCGIVDAGSAESNDETDRDSECNVPLQKLASKLERKKNEEKEAANTLAQAANTSIQKPAPIIENPPQKRQRLMCRIKKKNGKMVVENVLSDNHGLNNNKENRKIGRKSRKRKGHYCGEIKMKKLKIVMKPLKVHLLKSLTNLKE